MREIPISFTTAMVREILAGRKTVTRRPIKPQPVIAADVEEACMRGFQQCSNCDAVGCCDNTTFPRPRWGKGDRLYVKEATMNTTDSCGLPWTLYRSDYHDEEAGHMGRWKTARFMRKADARIWLTVTDVHPQRIQDATEDDARAEGFASREAFRDTIDAIYGTELWASNAWVWVIEFEANPSRKSNS
jgi:uncharacterized protein YqfB (UPF0267 family)